MIEKLEEIKLAMERVIPMNNEVWFMDNNNVHHGKIFGADCRWRTSSEYASTTVILHVRCTYGDLGCDKEVDAERCYPSKEELKNALFPPSESNILSFQIPFPLESLVWLHTKNGIESGIVKGYGYDLTMPMQITVMLSNFGGSFMTTSAVRASATREELENNINPKS